MGENDSRELDNVRARLVEVESGAERLRTQAATDARTIAALQTELDRREGTYKEE